ncbi:MAG: heat shock protein HspQ [Verrucomicrobiota bacterium]
MISLRDGFLEEAAAYEIGELVRHRRYGYRGVVVAVTERFEGADEWYQKNQTQPAKDQAWYHVLVHGSPSVTYAAQSSLEADGSGAVVVHPLLEMFFSGFEEGRYLRNSVPWEL